LPQDPTDFDDHHDPDADLVDDDDNVQANTGLDQKADADFDLDLIRREITGEAHQNIKKERVEAIDDDDDDTDDYDYVFDGNDGDDGSEPEKSVDSVDDDLRPDNGKISTQVSGNDDDEVEDSDDGDDADIVPEINDSDDDEKLDLDYQQDDDSAMADDDYINDSKIEEVGDNDDNDFTMDYQDDDNDDDSGDSDDRDATDDDFFSKDYLKFVALDVISLDNLKLNLTTVDIDADKDNLKADLNGVYYQADDYKDSDSGYDDDSDSDYDIYDSSYREESEKANLSSYESKDLSNDYDIFLDIDDSVWASYLTNDDNAGNQ